MTERDQCPQCGSAELTYRKKRKTYLCEDCDHEFPAQQPFVPQRVFVSYGHDEHAVIARKIREDLQARGHHLWFDDQIREGEDWECQIEEGLEWLTVAKPDAAVVLLLTPHAVRRPDGYCLNEVARALSRGLRIIPAMIVACEPPLSICRIQWLDMTPCIPVSEKNEIYARRFERLLDALEKGQLDFEGTQQRLIKALKPQPFEADILKHLHRFIGRDWVFEAIDVWLANPHASRIFWVMGGPGVGKTAVAAVVSHRYPQVGAMHLCRFGHTQKADPRIVVTSIAYQLATQLPEYEAALTRLDLDDLNTESARTIFDRLLVQPLAQIAAPPQPFVIVIDALDEASEDGRNRLAGFLASEFPRTRNWLRLLITSRPERAVTAPLQGLDPFILNTDHKENHNDIRAYMRCEIADILAQRRDPEADVEAVLQPSEGLFLYIEQVCEDLRVGRLSLDSPEAFPAGLGGVFWQYCERQFPDRDRYQKCVRPALRLILAAREPLPIVILQATFGWTDEVIGDFRRELGSLFVIAGEGADVVVQPYHKGLVDWLTDEARADIYFVSMAEGDKALAELGWQSYQEHAASCSPYFRRHLPEHLSASGQWQRLETLILEDTFPFSETFPFVSKFPCNWDFSSLRNRLFECSDFTWHEASQGRLNLSGLKKSFFIFPKALSSSTVELFTTLIETNKNRMPLFFESSFSDIDCGLPFNPEKIWIYASIRLTFSHLSAYGVQVENYRQFLTELRRYSLYMDGEYVLESSISMIASNFRGAYRGEFDESDGFINALSLTIEAMSPDPNMELIFKLLPLTPIELRTEAADQAIADNVRIAELIRNTKPESEA